MVDLSPLLPILQAQKGKGGGGLMGALLGAQKTYGYLPSEALQAIATSLCLPLSHVFGVATFYPRFRLSPPGRHIIRACTGTSCHVCGGASLLSALKAALGIEEGQTTPDGRFTLEVAGCLGFCALAPAIMIDDHCHPRAEPEEIEAILAPYP